MRASHTANGLSTVYLLPTPLWGYGYRWDRTVPSILLGYRWESIGLSHVSYYNDTHGSPSDCPTCPTTMIHMGIHWTVTLVLLQRYTWESIGQSQLDCPTCHSPVESDGQWVNGVYRGTHGSPSDCPIYPTWYRLDPLDHPTCPTWYSGIGRTVG